MNQDFFTGNRQALQKSMVEDSLAIFFAGEAPYKAGDETYPFTPNRNFYYLTGMDRPRGILLMQKTEINRESVLFIERDNGPMAKWVGANITPKEAGEVSGIQEIDYIDRFEERIGQILLQAPCKKVYLDLEKRQWKGGEGEGIMFARILKEKYPSLSVEDCSGKLAQMRMIKQPCEVEMIQKAIDITIEGIEAMMANAKPGQKEYEIEAHFDYTLRRRGVKDKAFASIAAAGKNGCILHYTDNNHIAEDGDCILFDVGAQYGYYNGDITRTFPVNGVFTPLQRKIYDIVLEGNRRVINAIRPGIWFTDLNETLLDYYFDALRNIGLITAKEEISRYYFHGVSHYLGLETHDVGTRRNTRLCPGMVLTVEPGLYIEEYGIGIRIEDDVLVTENGRVVLTENMIKTADEIEEFMRRAREHGRKN